MLPIITTVTWYFVLFFLFLFIFIFIFHSQIYPPQPKKFLKIHIWSVLLSLKSLEISHTFRREVVS